jgi:hypothetical protein
MMAIFSSILIGLAALVVISLLVAKQGRGRNWPDDYPDGWG